MNNVDNWEDAWTQNEIKELCESNPDGFTVDLVHHEKVTRGIAVGFTHGLSIDDATVLANLIRRTPATWPAFVWTLGGWKDGDKYILDIGYVTRGTYALADAVDGAIKYKQDAVFDLETGKTTYVKPL